MRLNDKFSAAPSVLIISVLANPGTPSSKQWPRLNSEISNSSITWFWPDDHLRKLLEDFFAGVVQFADGGGIGANGAFAHAGCWG